MFNNPTEGKVQHPEKNVPGVGKAPPGKNREPPYPGGEDRYHRSSARTFMLQKEPGPTCK